MENLQEHHLALNMKAVNGEEWPDQWRRVKGGSFRFGLGGGAIEGSIPSPLF